MQDGYRIGGVLACLLGVMPLANGQSADNDHMNACEKVLRSNCDATQEEILKEFLQDLELYSVGKDPKAFDGDAPAFEALPKDRFGMVNWIKSVTDGVIRPRGTLSGAPEAPYEGFLENLMVRQVNAYFMADVVFPHGMHTYWLNCDSCHPEPFAEKAGSTKMTMKGIMQGQWCGKCHGKVAFPPSEYENCRRCHSITKDSLGG
jgi:c(7)-type cytochrome triheme protein